MNRGLNGRGSYDKATDDIQSEVLEGDEHPQPQSTLRIDGPSAPTTKG